jgi:tripartite ATP-independent transporter DctP family solute receptor
MSGNSRAAFIASSAAAFASVAIVRSPAKAAEFTGKAGTNQPPDHPLSVAMKDLWDNVRKETNGRVDVTVFPNNQLGGDTAMLQQLRSGALQVMTLDGGILEAVVPVGAIQSVGFAFNDSPAAFRAFDGKLGAYVRGEIGAKGLHAFDKIWENGMREITASTKPVRNAADIAGMKIRTPNSRMALDLFKALGAAPTPINFSELYTALQTKVVDGQENPLANIEFARFFEVQKYLSMSSHMWGGYWLLAENAWWAKIPADAQAIITRNASTITDRQRRDIMKLNDSLVGKLQSQGMTVNTLSAADRATMKAKLSDFYKRWKAEFGETAWGLLEGYTGKLA